MDRSKSALADECVHSATELVVSEQDIAAEIALRREFFLSRLEGRIDERDLRDLTEMTTNDGAAVYRCTDCGLLVRADPSRTPIRFACDEYDERTLRMLHELHVATFAAKTNIRELLGRGSCVL